MLSEMLGSVAYPWTKTLHVIAVISWMAGVVLSAQIALRPSHRVGSPWVVRHRCAVPDDGSQKLLKRHHEPSDDCTTWIFRSGAGS